jgi:hypothetical protein
MIARCRLTASLAQPSRLAIRFLRPAYPPRLGVRYPSHIDSTIRRPLAERVTATI